MLSPSGLAPSTPQIPAASLELLSNVRYIAAPMVGQSDVAWRSLLRDHNASIVYTQMFESDKFVKEEEYRKEMFVTTASDRPLIVQFAANDADTLVQAAKMVEPYCDAVCLNLGCPQRAARSSLYGAFLLDEEHHEHVYGIVRAAKAALSIPLCVKIRLLPTLHASIKFALGLVAAGANVLTIHGRTRGFVEERRKGPADLQQVRQIFAAIRRYEAELINKRTHPTILWTNGNVRCDDDVEANISFTGANGCMVGEALLNDPSLFSRAGNNAQSLNAVDVRLASFPAPSSLLTTDEFDRKVTLMEEYLTRLHDPSQQYSSPFASSSTPSAPASPFAVPVTEFSTKLVSWANFHSHIYHLLNSDIRARFLYHTQLVDEFLDCLTLTELRAVISEARCRIQQDRPFDSALQATIESNRSQRQKARDARSRKRLQQEHVAAGGVKQLNSRERKRARWHQRKQDEKRQKMQEDGVNRDRTLKNEQQDATQK